MIISPMMKTAIQAITALIAGVLAMVRPELAAAAGLYLVLELRIKSVVIKVGLQRDLERMARENPTSLPNENPPTALPSAPPSSVEPRESDSSLTTRKDG